jgi:hypothetical protein
MSDLSSLEPGQLTSVTRMPLARAKLGRGVLILLALMRLYVLAAIPIVAYAFIRALQAG